jgi:cation diffusion facilitator family transporter
MIDTSRCVVVILGMMMPAGKPQAARFYALLSIGAAISTITLKFGAYKLTGSIALKSDGRHLLTDVWTSAGIVGGLIAANLTGWQILDPLVAILVAINILKEGFHILQETTAGLLDAALPKKEQMIIQKVLRRYQNSGVCFQRLKTRLAGSQRFVSVNILVPGSWSVEQGHYICDVIEIAIANALPGTHTTTHLEPLKSTP